MTDPNSRPLRLAILPQDNFRSVVAGLITLLTLYGWIDALGRTPLRQALLAQTNLWWIEQVVGFVLAIVCIGIIMRKRSFLAPAFWLTIYSLVFDVMRWIFEFYDGEVRIPIAMILYALFLWRLLMTRKQVAASEGILPIETTA